MLQARTAELLQLHTELRQALFGSSSVLAKSILPSAIPLDLLKFLKLWDYEGGLSPGVRYRPFCRQWARRFLLLAAA